MLRAPAPAAGCGNTEDARKGDTHTVVSARVGGHPKVAVEEKKPSAPRVRRQRVKGQLEHLYQVAHDTQRT